MEAGGPFGGFPPRMRKEWEWKAAILDARHAFRMVGMKNYYMEIDGMSITCGDIRREGLADIVPYYVERDDGEGDFDFAEGSLPTCTPMRSRGFTESELWEIESLMRDNMPSSTTTSAAWGLGHESHIPQAEGLAD